ncbi:MAG: hypothetical protein LBF61_11030 [Azoarcus sp.]|jgi:hypothetical protein|nr:hypothetical protein [Azoarcus sp.]
MRASLMMRPSGQRRISRAQSTGGRGYQTLINAALREVMQGRRFADDLRRIIREELS